MVVNERLIIIPIPDFNLATNKPVDEGFCLSYQYDIDCKGRGPYGFNTTLAENFVRAMFPSVYYYDKKIESLDIKNKVDEYGLYLFENFEELKIESDKYKLLLKKNELMSRKGIKPNAVDKTPVLYNVYFGDKINNSVIISLKSKHVGFFVVNSYSPETGKSFLFYDVDVINKIKIQARKLGIQLVNLSSIDELVPW